MQRWFAVCSVVLEGPEELLLIEASERFYQGQVVAMLRWAVSQIRGQGEIPTHSEVDAIARRLMLLEGAFGSNEGRFYKRGGKSCMLDLLKLNLLFAGMLLILAVGCDRGDKMVAPLVADEIAAPPTEEAPPPTEEAEIALDGEEGIPEEERVPEFTEPEFAWFGAPKEVIAFESLDDRGLPSPVYDPRSQEACIDAGACLIVYFQREWQGNGTYSYRPLVPELLRLSENPSGASVLLTPPELEASEAIGESYVYVFDEDVGWRVLFYGLEEDEVPLLDPLARWLSRPEEIPLGEEREFAWFGAPKEAIVFEFVNLESFRPVRGLVPGIGHSPNQKTCEATGACLSYWVERHWDGTGSHDFRPLRPESIRLSENPSGAWVALNSRELEAAEAINESFVLVFDEDVGWRLLFYNLGEDEVPLLDPLARWKRRNP